MSWQHRESGDLNRWEDNDVYVHDMSYIVVIAPGSIQRALPCYMCRRAIGGLEAILTIIVVPKVCPCPARHLIAGGYFRHALCEPADNTSVIQRIRNMPEHGGH